MSGSSVAGLIGGSVVDEFDKADRDDYLLDRADEHELERLDWAELHGEYHESPGLAELLRVQAALKREAWARSQRMVCWRCHGTGYVTVAGPDENGLYDADDCPDCGGIPHG